MTSSSQYLARLGAGSSTHIAAMSADWALARHRGEKSHTLRLANCHGDKDCRRGSVLCLLYCHSQSYMQKIYNAQTYDASVICKLP